MGGESSFTSLGEGEGSAEKGRDALIPLISLGKGEEGKRGANSCGEGGNAASRNARKRVSMILIAREKEKRARKKKSDSALQQMES